MTAKKTTIKDEVAAVVRAAEGGYFDAELDRWWQRGTSSYRFPSNEDRAVARAIVVKAEALFGRRLRNRWRAFDAIMDYDFDKRYPGTEARWATGWRKRLEREVREIPWP